MAERKTIRPVSTEKSEGYEPNPSRLKQSRPEQKNTASAASAPETGSTGEPAHQKPAIFKEIVSTTVWAIVGTICSAILTIVIIVNFVDLRSFRAKQNALLELVDSFETSSGHEADTAQFPYDNTLDSLPQYISAFDTEMRGINPDYICWIKIENTVVDYPVVRGADNDKYLNLSFYNERSALGALFMDYRCTGEHVPHIIIYGHNAGSGELFGGLRNFLDERYLADHTVISLKVNDNIVDYEIFSARESDVTDPAYDLDFGHPGAFSAFAEKCGAPSDAAQILTLSTCVSAGNNDARVIVQGALRDIEAT